MSDKELTPTAEQEKILSAFSNSTSNLSISALAGAAKTSTLKLICSANPQTQFLYLAFNKRIADEARAKLPENTIVSTLNSLGHRTWSAAIGKKARVYDKKLFDLVKSHSSRLEDPDDFADLLDMLKKAKVYGYHPEAKKSIGLEELIDHFEIEPTDTQLKLIDEILVESCQMARNGTVDFADQIYMPTLFPVKFDTYPNILIDEAQDLSSLNHLFLAKLLGKSSRIIAVGDPNQAIYAFRGASRSSMKDLGFLFSMENYDLTTSFRCAKEITRSVHDLTPHMQWPDWAEEGRVEELSSWLPERGSAVICRNNAPLFRLAVRLLSAGIRPNLVGQRDIVLAILKTFRSFSPKKNIPQEEVFAHIESWLQKKIAKARNPASFEDQAECMRILAQKGTDLHSICTYINKLIETEGSVELLTGHRSKGLEFETVYFLDRELLRDAGQDVNLRYVIHTRAKRELFFVSSENLATNNGDAE